MKLKSCKLRKVTIPSIWKKIKSRRPKKSQKWPKNQVLDFFYQNVIHSYIHFLLGNESNNCLLTLCKSHMTRKNLGLEFWSKNFEISQNAGFFKLQYLANKLRYETEFQYVTRHLQKQQIQSITSSRCGQSCQT